ncbi:Auxin response factor 10 [Hordeum vulgare]|nr:Auxin response factor 10 [Hordeum vulgare]
MSPITAAPAPPAADGTTVYYFPQGHAEQATAAVDMSAARVPALLAHRISAVGFMANAHSDKVFTKIRLIPIRHGDPAVNMGAVAAEGTTEDFRPKPASFANTLTQSDANNGGGFSDPLFCTKTIFPALDYSSEPPVQSIVVRDVHGDDFKFLHIYRGTPLRHLLTTGWSNLVNQKKLLAGDSIVFLHCQIITFLRCQIIVSDPSSRRRTGLARALRPLRTALD